MVMIYAAERGGSWKLLKEDSPARALMDPARTGEYYFNTYMSLHPKAVDAVPGGINHFATNYGMPTFFSPATTHVKLNDGKKGLVLIHLTDMAIDLDRLPETAGKKDAGKKEANLTPNPLKMTGQGFTHVVYTSPSLVMDELRSSLNFVGPENGEAPSYFLDRIDAEARKQREKKITPELLNRINREYYGMMGWNEPATLEGLRLYFLDPDRHVLSSLLSSDL